MNEMTDGWLRASGFERRERPIAYNKATKEFRYQCSCCLTWHRRIVFAEAKPVCDACESLRQASAKHSLYHGLSFTPGS